MVTVVLIKQGVSRFYVRRVVCELSQKDAIVEIWKARGYTLQSVQYNLNIS